MAHQRFSTLPVLKILLREFGLRPEAVASNLMPTAAPVMISVSGSCASWPPACFLALALYTPSAAGIRIALDRRPFGRWQSSVGKVATSETQHPEGRSDVHTMTAQPQWQQCALKSSPPPVFEAQPNVKCETSA